MTLVSKNPKRNNYSAKEHLKKVVKGSFIYQRIHMHYYHITAPQAGLRWRHTCWSLSAPEQCICV